MKQVALVRAMFLLCNSVFILKGPLHLGLGVVFAFVWFTWFFFGYYHITMKSASEPESPFRQPQTVKLNR